MNGKKATKKNQRVCQNNKKKKRKKKKTSNIFVLYFICCGITQEKHQLLSDSKKKEKENEEHLVMLTHFKITHIYSPKTQSTDQACENEEENLTIDLLLCCYFARSLMKNLLWQRIG